LFDDGSLQVSLVESQKGMLYPDEALDCQGGRSLCGRARAAQD
jgi:hypothetical protein